MKYFQVGLDVEVAGIRDGLYQIDIELQKLQKDKRFISLFNVFNIQNSEFWHNQDEIQKIKIPVIPAKLLKKANITDIMGYTQNIYFLNLVYSKKFIDIIKSFNIDSHYIFEVNISNVVQKYFMLFIKTVLLEEINYQKSTIITGHKKINNIEYHNINNREEYREFKIKNPLGKFEKITLPMQYFGKDIINIQAISKSFYSEKLIDFLLDCGITGLDVKYNNSIQLEFV